MFDKFASNINYTSYLQAGTSCIFIQHAGFEDDFKLHSTRHIVKNTFKRNPFYLIGLLRFVKEQKPDVVLMHGMINPLRIILAGFILGPKIKILLQNHAEKPGRHYHGSLQRIASKFISGFLFASKEQSLAWREKGIITQRHKVYEVMEGSTTFKPGNKAQARELLGVDDKALLFLWVGRLVANKDPLTILKGFSQFALQQPRALLLMIYSTNELLPEVKEFVRTNGLEKQVILKGKIPHADLENYYRAADYFILGSHYEGSGYALCEAMACGCVPIVTSIHSFNTMLNGDESGYRFEPGNEKELYQILSGLDPADYTDKSRKVLERFATTLSFAAIAKKIEAIAEDTLGR